MDQQLRSGPLGIAIAAQPPRNACRVMVGLLALTHERACEADLDGELNTILNDGDLPELPALQRRFMPAGTAVPTVSVTIPPAIANDALLNTPQEWLAS
jgi:hypothetical protein